jgi:hypothetical protein
MWTEEQRRLYQREGEGHPSDLRDAEWARLEPLIPKASPGKGLRRPAAPLGGRAHLLLVLTNRRLAKDSENLAEILATFVTLASIQLALRRPARA